MTASTTARNLSHTARLLLEATSGTLGEDMFVAMARAITEAFGARWGFVGELISSTRVRTRGGWTAGAAIPAVEYDLEGTPCAEVVWNSACSYPDDVQQRFPEDHMLVEMGARGYFGMPVFGRRGTPIGLIVVLHDAPLHVDGHEDVLRLFAMRVAAELERERADHLLRQHERMQSLALLSGFVARDFNNLLTAIMANASLAHMQLGAAPHEDIATLMHEIEESARTAAGLTQQLLAFSGSSDTQRAPIDFAAVVRETARLVHPLLPEGVQLRVDLGEELPPVRGDMAQLRQVVINTVRNAGEALTGRRGVVRVTAAVAAACASGYDRTTFQSEGFDPGSAHFALTIHDTGPGLDDAARAHLFVPLFTTKAEGRGLGLAITAGIVDKHRGAIDVQSAADSGTTVTIYLPVVAANTDGAGANRPFAGSRILVADDDAAVLGTLKRSLAALGCAVTEVANGDAALEILRQRPAAFDCAVLDVDMPGICGDDIAIVQHGDAGSVPIVLSSGMSADRLDEFVRSGAVAATLAKPWTRNDLVDALTAALPPQAQITTKL